jgi:hypothetical protein
MRGLFLRGCLSLGRLGDNPDRYSRLLAFFIINFCQTVATDTEPLPIQC